MLNAIKWSILNLENKIDAMEEEFKTKALLTENRTIKHKILKERVNEVIRQNSKKDLVTINIGNKVFTTLYENIKNIDSPLLRRLVEINRNIFIDRSSKYFHFIMYYIRHKKLDSDKIQYGELQNVLEEFEYYNIFDIVGYLRSRIGEVRFVNYESSGAYYYNDVMIGTNIVEDLHNKDVTTGLSTGMNGWIIIEFDKECTLEEFEVQTLQDINWSSSHGNNSSVSFSKNRIIWEYKTMLLKNGELCKFKRTTAKYIKFESNLFIGLSYLKIKKIF
jgi:hypothetical protein